MVGFAKSFRVQPINCVEVVLRCVVVGVVTIKALWSLFLDKFYVYQVLFCINVPL